jgi:HlyD family secretion protein
MRALPCVPVHLSGSAQPHLSGSGQVHAEAWQKAHRQARIAHGTALAKMTGMTVTRTCMDQIPPSAVTGAAMDSVVPRRRGRLWLRLALGAAFAAGAAWAFWQLMPHGLQVPRRDVRIARAEAGVFRDDVVVRATAEPLHSIILDSVESGRVEEVFAKDGQAVKKGDLLFRLSNPQRHLELLARQTEYSQQIFNAANLRVAQEAVRTEHQRRLSDLEFTLAQADKQHARNRRLASQGFISAVALEESADKLAQQQRALEEEKRAIATEEQVRGRALQQMDGALHGLQSGLRLVSATVEALAVRAPSDGVLTDFRMLVGQTVRPDQHIGRIDDPRHFKLSAQIDEFYLSRVAVGRSGRVVQDGRTHELQVSTVYPQIKEGRFTAEMVFTRGQPAVISPGQGLDAQLTLGEPALALLLPNGAFVSDTGGAWAFVVARDGERVEKRAVRLGRRNNSQVEVLSGLAAGESVIVSGYTPFGKAERLQLTRQ